MLMGNDLLGDLHLDFRLARPLHLLSHRRSSVLRVIPFTRWRNSHVKTTFRFILYDTSRIINHLGCDDYAIAAIELYLDVVNLFLRTPPPPPHPNPLVPFLFFWVLKFSSCPFVDSFCLGFPPPSDHSLHQKNPNGFDNMPSLFDWVYDRHPLACGWRKKVETERHVIIQIDHH